MWGGILFGHAAASSSRDFRGTGLKATGRKTRPRGRPSPKASTSPCSRISSPCCSIRHASGTEARPCMALPLRRRRREGAAGHAGGPWHSQDLPAHSLSIKGFPESTGTAGGNRAGKWSRVSPNLIVESAKSVSDARLKEMLREELKKQGKPWACTSAASLEASPPPAGADSRRSP